MEFVFGSFSAKRCFSPAPVFEGENLPNDGWALAELLLLLLLELKLPVEVLEAPELDAALEEEGSLQVT